MKTLSCYISEELAKQGLSQSKAAGLAKMSKGHFNNVLSGEQKYTLQVVEKLIEAIGLDRFTAYELYSKEVFREDANKIKKKREELLKRCIECGFTQLAESVAAAMLEEGSTAVGFYKIAEEYRLAGKEDEAVGLYNKAMSLETDRYSELLAVCLYRKFSILRVRDFDLYDICLEMSMHIENLPFYDDAELQAEKMEAYRRLITSWYVMEKYEQVIFYCDRLAELTTLESCKDKRVARRYHGLSLVYKGFAARATKQYGLALDLIDAYQDNDTDDFAKWATYNRYAVQLDMGQVDKIPAMLDFIRQNPMNNTGIVLALQTYLRYNMVNEAAGMIQEHQEQIGHILANGDKLYQKWICELQLALSILSRLTGDNEKGKAHLLDALRAATTLKQQTHWFDCIREYNSHYIMTGTDHSDYFQLLAESDRLFKKGK